MRRNHQKYKTRMEQPRVNWDRGQYDVTLVKFWRQALRIHSVNVIRQRVVCNLVSSYFGKSPSLFRFTRLYEFDAVQE